MITLEGSCLFCQGLHKSLQDTVGRFARFSSFCKKTKCNQERLSHFGNCAIWYKPKLSYTIMALDSEGTVWCTQTQIWHQYHDPSKVIISPGLLWHLCSSQALKIDLTPPISLTNPLHFGTPKIWAFDKETSCSIGIFWYCLRSSIRGRSSTDELCF